MSQVGQRERITQNRVVHFFQQQLGYRYLGDWQDRNDNKNIEHDILIAWLADSSGKCNSIKTSHNFTRCIPT